MIRATLTAVFFFTVTPILIGVQWLVGRLGLPGWGTIARRYYRVLIYILGIRVRVVGRLMPNHAVLLVSNHVSWADILVIGASAPVAFISKKEIGNWPLVGITAKLQKTVFVDRAKRHQTGDAIGEIVGRLAEGTSLVLFAEGTSSDGNRVLPFRSALLGAIKHVASHGGFKHPMVIQPMSICYTALNGIAMGRQFRPVIAWYGDIDFMPHIKGLMGRGAIDAVVTFGEPIVVDATTDRKAMTRQLETTIRGILTSTLRGRELPARGGSTAH